MASINATSASVVRPYPGAVAARAAAKAVPQELDQGEPGRKVKLGMPSFGRTGAVQIGEDLGSAIVNEQQQNTRAPSATPNSSGVEPVQEPVDLSGVSPRTAAVVDHTLGVMMNAGVWDTESMVGQLAKFIEPLLAQDGVANPKVAAEQYIREMAAKADIPAETDTVGVKASASAKGGLDLEG